MNIKPPKPKKSQYITIADFEDTVGDGISFSKGENVEVRCSFKKYYFEKLVSVVLFGNKTNQKKKMFALIKKNNKRNEMFLDIYAFLDKDALYSQRFFC